jgi:hypothetical protein
MTASSAFFISKGARNISNCLYIKKEDVFGDG